MNFPDLMELTNRGEKAQKEIDEILSREREGEPCPPSDSAVSVENPKLPDTSTPLP